jgi:hypothetical protein
VQQFVGSTQIVRSKTLSRPRVLGRQRAAIAVAAAVAALIGLGQWRRADLMAERSAARADRVAAIHQLHGLREGLRIASSASGAVESDTLVTRHASEALVTLTGDLAAQITMVERQRNDAAIGAYVAGGQVGRLRECLDGVNRALNQISVGDPNGPNTLNAVRGACRAVGA